MGADIYLPSVYNINGALWFPVLDAAVDHRDAVSDTTRDAAMTRLLAALADIERSPLASDNPEAVAGVREKIGALATASDEDTRQAIVTAAHAAMYSVAVGYFRDSDNETNLMHRYGLSWSDGPPIIDRTNMTPESAKRLRDFLGSTPVPKVEPGMLKHAKDADTAEGCAGWDAYFDRKRLSFIKLLDRAIGLGETLDCDY